MATFHQISSQNLECSICLTLFKEPKLLACSHTFCKDCLERVFQTQPSKETLVCPVCRNGTPLLNGDVCMLPTNVSKCSLLEEMRTKSPTCTLCNIQEKPPAVSYCQDCGQNMCTSCEKTHSIWTPFSAHSVVAMSEVLSGKVPIRRRRKCKIHPSADEEYFCNHCREYICGTCGMVEHSQAGHQLERASIHEEKLTKNISELRERVKSKRETVENHLQVIETQRNEIANMMRRLNDDIDKAYEEHVRLLLARRQALKHQVQEWCGNFEAES